jgi:hypothetical protein
MGTMGHNGHNGNPKNSAKTFLTAETRNRGIAEKTNGIRILLAANHVTAKPTPNRKPHSPQRTTNCLMGYGQSQTHGT